MTLPGQTGGLRHDVLNLSICLSVTKLMNTTLRDNEETVLMLVDTGGPWGKCMK